MSRDTKMKNDWDFLLKGTFPKSDFWFLRNLQNFPKTQTQAQDAQNMLQSKSWLNSKVSVMSEDTGNAKFVQNYNREFFLEKSLFWVEEPGCSSRTQKPAHQSADFSAKQGVTPGGNDLELFLGQSWVSSQKMGSVSRKTKNAIFFAFYQIRKLSKGGTLGIEKFQSAPIWTKLAGLVGTIKKTSWDVILKCSCTLLGTERPKTKNDAKGGPLE